MTNSQETCTSKGPASYYQKEEEEEEDVCDSDGIIDLNHVTISDDFDKEIVDEEYESGESEHENESGSEDDDEIKPTTMKKPKLVYCEDDIPDDVFKSMLSEGSTHSKKAKAAANEGVSVSSRRRKGSSNGSLVALILMPTRELALQVVEHIKAAAYFTDIKVRI